MVYVELNSTVITPALDLLFIGEATAEEVLTGIRAEVERIFWQEGKDVRTETAKVSVLPYFTKTKEGFIVRVFDVHVHYGWFDRIGARDSAAGWLD